MGLACKQLLILESAMPEARAMLDAIGRVSRKIRQVVKALAANNPFRAEYRIFPVYLRFAGLTPEMVAEEFEAVLRVSKAPKSYEAVGWIYDDSGRTDVSFVMDVCLRHLIEHGKLDADERAVIDEVRSFSEWAAADWQSMGYKLTWEGYFCEERGYWLPPLRDGEP